MKTGAASVASLSVGVSGVGSLGLGTRTRGIEESALEAIRAEFDKLFKSGRPILLCLDEVQHLATDRAFEPLVYFLRTLIDIHRQALKVVYTGSSRDGLQRLFNRRKAPLFNSASQIDLPELGSDFVRHILAAFHEATQRTIRCRMVSLRSSRLIRFPMSYDEWSSCLCMKAEPILKAKPAGTWMMALRLPDTKPCGRA